MEKWILQNKGADFAAWVSRFGISPLLARLIRNRGVQSLEQLGQYLEGEWRDSHSPSLLPDMDRALDCLGRALDNGAHIRVIGDYDVDGVCAAYILTRGISSLGGQVSAAIPHRIQDGYGINVRLVEEAKAQGCRLILTCDNGISAGEATALAQSLGMEVVVTDHHEVPVDGRGLVLLPPAGAVVNPKRPDSIYPEPGICGALVAFKLVWALAQARGGELEFAELLAAVALATVCDIMPLLGENRVFVKAGLEALRRGSHPGLSALAQAAGLEEAAIDAYHLGFVLGPCLNAAGRLREAGMALELLGASGQRALALAGELVEVNAGRKDLTAQALEEAWAYIEERGLGEDPVLLVYLPQAHESLAGILAGRIRERYHRPSFVLTRGEGCIKGSGRSIDAYSMYEKLCQAQDLLARFGGHKGAAGFTLAGGEEAIEPLRLRLLTHAGLSEEDFYELVRLDLELPMARADMALAAELESLAPFGHQNPKPLFVQRAVVVERVSPMGREGAYARLTVQPEPGLRRQMVYFAHADGLGRCIVAKAGSQAWSQVLAGRGRVALDMAYQVEISRYNGQESVKWILKHFR